MIAAIKGRLAGRAGDSLLIDIGSLVLQVHTSATTIVDIGSTESEVRLFTYLYLREDQLALYGFATTEELALFNRLLGVSGIGPRVATGMLSASRPDQLLNAITNEDTAFLSRLPGIGRKTAARIILDLRGKLADIGGGGAVTAHSTVDSEVVGALQALGYTTAEANAAVNRLTSESGDTVEARVVAALQQMSER